ncbi:sodium:proton antiporter [Bradyrhizobium sp.]|uniref:sodium:proton antiporter n=1 Tax=Bradyrhizobium sp. TaxID=376 RepID=UPI00273776F7|nr:sodium:proton antiporter [Bradyrhizobium sp.]MDP3077046.1 sodium:proton antiporter [Bradyrhizobium sp.]
MRRGTLSVFGTEVAIQDLLRNATMIVTTIASLAIAPKANHEANRLLWTPIAEVATLFARIFVTIIPV